MTREVKIKVTQEQLCVILRVVDNFVMFPKNDTERMVLSILTDVFTRLKKKLIEKRPKYTIGLRVHEAIALRGILLTSHFPYESYEENEIRILTSEMARQL